MTQVEIKGIPENPVLLEPGINRFHGENRVSVEEITIFV